jgi:hypothetical protein
MQIYLVEAMIIYLPSIVVKDIHMHMHTTGKHRTECVAQDQDPSLGCSVSIRIARSERIVEFAIPAAHGRTEK